MEIGYNIAAVERDTGLSKDVLRMWERRYGFPSPTRDEHGNRLYPVEQVERLRLIKRLMDQGHRPGKLITVSYEELLRLAPRRAPPASTRSEDDGPELEGLIELIRVHETDGFQMAMQHRMARQGLQAFVQDTVAPLARRIGEDWERGKLEVFEEHVFTELTKRLLRQAIAALPPAGRRPRILLTTLPGEEHGLGLLMAETLFSLEGCDCIPLGTQTPLVEIVRAASAHQADVVALSFSAAFPTRQIAPLLEQLRAALPEAVALWAGGAGLARIDAIEGVRSFLTLEDGLAALAAWRAESP